MQLAAYKRSLAELVELLDEACLGVAYDNGGAKSQALLVEGCKRRVALFMAMIDRRERMHRKLIDVEESIREQLCLVHLVETPVEDLPCKQIDTLKRNFS